LQALNRGDADSHGRRRMEQKSRFHHHTGSS